MVSRSQRQHQIAELERHQRVSFLWKQRLCRLAPVQKGAAWLPAQTGRQSLRRIIKGVAGRASGMEGRPGHRPWLASRTDKV
eukprot:6467315-Prorocentrum_lima.AAC.1